jgi:hypothetical protein
MEKRVLSVHERFRNLQKLKKPLYISASTIITSCKEALEAQGKTDLAPMAYLECLLNIKDNFRKINHVKDEGFVYALSAVLSMVPIEVISQLHDILLEYITDVIDKNTNNIVIKYCVVVIQFLLESKTKDQWKNDEATIDLFMKLFNFCMHPKELVNRQAIRSFMIVCQRKDLSYFSKPLNIIENAIFKIMKQGSLNKQR